MLRLPLDAEFRFRNELPDLVLQLKGTIIAVAYGATNSTGVFVTTLAGTNSPGFINSTNPLEVRFNMPNGIRYWEDGLLAVADAQNHSIRLVDEQGSTITFAGTGQGGFINAPALLARFNYPLGLYVDRRSDILVADTENDVIRRVINSGAPETTTFAGSGARGYADGSANVARFSFPNDLVTDSAGNIFVTEFNNHTVSKISTDGHVTTFAGNGSPGVINGTGELAAFDSPAGLAIDAFDNLYVTEWKNHSVRKVSPAGEVTTFCGGLGPGFIDGPRDRARLNTPDGIALSPQGTIYITEQANHAIRAIDSQPRFRSLGV